MFAISMSSRWCQEKMKKMASFTHTALLLSCIMHQNLSPLSTTSLHRPFCSFLQPFHMPWFNPTTEHHHSNCSIPSCMFRSQTFKTPFTLSFHHLLGFPLFLVPSTPQATYCPKTFHLEHIHFLYIFVSAIQH